ncbi:unnamed protein product [Kuraishia capsulata CBS 1993]|uniref:Sugar phosphate phosphatase n=1 Tax=Kuraishia capsulata CBS 1993 TaxID=1382522 RepID=W6ML94_9ASCO|nr:uncharacterized protein KUCA_T00001517001 [Kuraishia capsulata CBS 1993]CDK25547.1 unnamed protein product [Kuraishia capsulata CBS 1993]
MTNFSVPDVYYNNDPTSFAFSTAHARWPKIVKGTIADVLLEIESQHNKDAEVVSQAKSILQLLEGLLHDITNDGPIEPFTAILPGLDSYNEVIGSWDSPKTWLTGPWLFTECYMYRKIDSFFKSNSKFQEYDVFNRPKRETFKSSTLGIYELILRYHQLHDQIVAKGAQNLDQESLKLLFEEFVDVSLWGNATDLSLLANATLDDIKAVQGKEARAKSAKNILANDLDQAWSQLLSVPLEKRRVDFVLDNAGFELFTDLVLSLFLLDSQLTSQVVFHCKTRPWMVSDTMIKDYHILIDDLQNPELFPDHLDEVKFFVAQLEKYRESGKFKLVDSEFWTVGLDYQSLSPKDTKHYGAQAFELVKDSSLLIFKGDLNYRKLTGDRKWPRSTPFTTAIENLAKSGLKIFALRTCKADVCAGLAPGKDEELSEFWRSQGNEIGELWCSSGKWAVISFSKGDLQ